jgi:glycosyltransferase involved in cell wall biosynthesis
VPVKIIADVSFAARQFAVGGVTGVGRVIDETIPRLAGLPEIDVRVVGFQEHDLNPALTDRWVKQWAEMRLGNRENASSAYRYATGLGVPFGHLSCFLDQYLLRHPTDQKGLSFFVSVFSRCMRRVAKADRKVSFGDKSCDVYLLTFSPPPLGIPGSIPRIVIVYDVYPLRLPDECGESVTGSLQRIVDSLVPDRDAVVTISEFTKDDFCDLTGFPENRVIAGSLAADQAFHANVGDRMIGKVRKKYRIGAEPYFLSVANPQPRKNLETAIRAFDRVTRAMPDWPGKLVLSGSPALGWGSESIDRAVDALGTRATRVLRIESVGDDELAALYAGAKAFVFPSRFEGFGLPLLEAMRCGTPVICSNVTSLPEVGGSAPIYCDPLDVEAFASAMMLMITDLSVRKRMVEAGLLQSARFSWEKMATAIQAATKLVV